jgi:hypothetical protein
MARRSPNFLPIQESRKLTTPNVTPNLASTGQRADDVQGGGGSNSDRDDGSKYFGIKILTSKPLGLKILQTIFANPAPVAAFRGGGGRGYPQNRGFPKMNSLKCKHPRPILEIFFGSYAQVNRQFLTPCFPPVKLLVHPAHRYYQKGSPCAQKPAIN